ncbi:MAG TPA: hypothetical protein VFS40_13015 [Gemmatimonadales bacterium]|nr:hypothetical protein [Gemmatimonadales bacterium]
MPGKDRQNAIRQNRNDLDTHDTNPPDYTAEEQVRGQRHHRNLPHSGDRKPKNG